MGIKISVALLVVTLLAITFASTALADPNDSNRATVTGNGNQGSAGYGDSGTQSSASRAWREDTPTAGAPAAGGSTPSDQASSLCGPGWISPNGSTAGTTCAFPQPAAPAPTPAQLAMQASAQQPWPKLTIQANPDGGVVGMEGWFWVAGNPAMPDATASVPSLTVTVRAQFVDAIWDLGDGATFHSGPDLGQPYPARSDIRHAYQTDSLGRPGGYPLSVEVVYQVTYSANGGPFQPLGLRGNTYTRSFVVSQIQPQGAGPR